MPTPRLAPDEEIDGSRSAPDPGFTRGGARRPEPPAQPAQLPATIEEAEVRYFRRYGWSLVIALFGPLPKPETVSEWYGLAEETRDYLGLSTAERLARRLEDLAAAIRREAAR